MYIDVHIPNYERHILHHMDISTKVALVLFGEFLLGLRYATSVVLTAFVRTVRLTSNGHLYFGELSS